MTQLSNSPFLTRISKLGMWWNDHLYEHLR